MRFESAPKNPHQTIFVLESAKRQLVLLDAIAEEPGKESSHYAQAIKANVKAIASDLKILANDGIVYSLQSENRLCWYIKPLKKYIKPCTLN
jgi:predicted transcriptional regulator